MGMSRIGPLMSHVGSPVHGNVGSPVHGNVTYIGPLMSHAVHGNVMYRAPNVTIM